MKIVTFKDGTDEEIQAMLDAHYAGKINISDTRLVHLNAINAKSYASKAHVAQDMTMVIIGIEHDDLQEQIGTRSKAAITVQCRETLGNNGSAEKEYYWGTSHYPSYDTENYTQSPFRTWLNDDFINAMPGEFKNLVKTVNKKNLCYHSLTRNAPLISNEKAFLLSYPEVSGKVTYVDYIQGKDPSDYEGEQYAYYQTSSNKLKYPNNNGNKGNSVDSWWLRSPASRNSSADYRWCRVWTSGNVSSSNGQATDGLAPAFCL